MSHIKPIKVLIDPGHGGQSRGCEIPGWGWEKDYTLMMAGKLGGLLADETWIELDYTRYSDEDVNFAQRAQHTADFVLSMHVDYNPSVGWGSWVGYDGGLGHAFANEFMAHRPRELMGSIVMPKQITEGHPMTGRMWNVMRRHSWKGRPGAVVEMFFASRAQDLTYGLSENGQMAILAAIIFGLVRVHRSSDSSQRSFS